MNSQSDMISRIVWIIRLLRIDLSNEKAAQSDIATILSRSGIEFQREVRLSDGDIIDFMVGDIGIEVKLFGARKQSVYRQLERYAKHCPVSCLILASNLRMGLPPKIEGKDLYFVSIGEGWM